MAQSVSSNHKHVDPPFLWVSVLAGSLLLNGAMTFGFQQYLKQTKPVSPAFTAIAVDFVSPVPRNRTTPSQGVSTPNSSSPPSKSTSPRPTVAPTPTTATPGNVSLANAPEVARPKKSRVTQSSTQGKVQNRSFQTVTRPTSTTSSSQTQDPTGAPPTNEISTSETAANTTNSIGHTTTQAEDQVATSGIRLPDFSPPPNPANNPGDSTEPTTDTFALKQKVTPAKFLLQVQVLEIKGNRPSDATLVTLQSEPFTKTFVSGEAGCSLTPEIVQNFNQPILFDLSLNTQGQVVDAIPKASSAGDNPSYQDLARCALQTWTLNPAIANSSPNSVPRSLSVKVTLTQP